MTHLYRILFGFSLLVALIVLPMMTNAQAATVAIAEPTSATEFFKLGTDETRSDQYEQAIADFTQVIKLDADFAAAYSNRCLVYIQLTDYAKAVDDCTAAVQRNPDNTEAYLNRGLAYYRLGEYQSAISEYTQVIERKSNDFRAYYNRGLARFELKDYTEAIADYNQALYKSHQHSDSLLADVYNDRGLAQLMLENVPEAITDFSLAINLDGANHRAFYNRACACHRNKDYTGAIRDFTLALQLDPNHAEAYINRGLIHHELGLQQAALSDLKTASKCFDKRGNQKAYRVTLALIEKIQQLLLSSDESEVSHVMEIAVIA